MSKHINGLTRMQKNIDITVLKSICKELHPTLTDEQLEKLKYSYKYSWVIVYFFVKNYGVVSFGINNHCTKEVVWGPISMTYARKLAHKGFITKVWRFIDDLFFNNENYIQEYNDNTIEKPTAEEYYRVYMKD